MPDYNWVTDRIALGGAVESLYDARKMEADGITHVLNLRTSQDEVPWFQKTKIHYMSNPSKDKDTKTKPPEWFDSSRRVIMATLLDPKARLLIHCQEGVNRAPSTLYFFLRSLGFSKNDVLDMITSARPKTKGGMAWNDDAEAALKELGMKG